jgi:hypothetical protein
MLPDEAPPKNPLTPSDMFALYPNDIYNKHHALEGPDECYWCSRPCTRDVPHDDGPLVLFKKTPLIARRPNNKYVCQGCDIYRRKRTTINYLDGSINDGKCLINFSWWIDREGPKVIDKRRWTKDGINLFREKLLNPPNSFCFSLITEGQKNHLQLCKANDLCVIKADTVLYYTLDNQVFNYSVYELKEALKHGPEGREPGVRLLVEMIGLDEPEEPKRGGGRPAGTAGWEKSPKAPVAASGNINTV